MTFIAGLPEVDRDEATDDRQEDKMKDPITYRVNADRLIRMALEEDITSEDLSTNCVMPEYQKGEVQLICKQDGVIAGLGVFKRVFELLDDTVSFDMRVEDGSVNGCYYRRYSCIAVRRENSIKLLAAHERYCYVYTIHCQDVRGQWHDIVRYPQNHTKYAHF